jgi:uncharacterized protein YdaU (DUF1376 family)
MHYYPHHIGDYKSATMHLSNEEDLAYRRLLEMYYDTEANIPLETQWVARRLRVGTEALESVLSDFFVRTEDGWKHSRCDLVIREYHEMAEKNRRNGKLGGRPKSSKSKVKNPVGSQSDPSGNPVATHSKANQEPITKTNNQEPSRNLATTVAPPDGVSSEVWDQFVKQRKVKKAQITGLVMAGIQREADKAGWTLERALAEVVVRNWTSFKAEWVAEKQQANTLTKTGLMNQTVMSGLTRGLMGGDKNVRFIEG